MVYSNGMDEEVRMRGAVAEGLQLLFIHGMGRSSLSGWPMLARLRQAGLKTATFGYQTSLQPFVAIRQQLATRIRALAAQGDYLLIGHSLGGVLIRAALAELPADTRLPCHVFLLGSPLRPARLARSLRGNPIYRILTGDCGQLLACDERMAAIPMPAVPLTVIAGTRGMKGRWSPFGLEENDGVVAFDEIDPDSGIEVVRLPLIHTWLPSSRGVSRELLKRVRKGGRHE